MLRAAILLLILMLPFSSRGEESLYLKSVDYWAHTGVQVRKDQSYRIGVTWHDVTDGKSWYLIRVNSLAGWPKGWQRVVAAPLFFLRRRPFDPWFSLIATVDRHAPRRLCSGADYVAPRDGELVCYFNDVPWAYANNGGGVRLHIEPVK